MSGWWRYSLLILGVLLITAPLIKCQEEEDDIEDDFDAAEEDAAEDDGSEEDGVPEENDVLILTESNFDDVVNSKETILVEFYAPWCGHCKQLAPKYEAAAARLKETDPPVSLAKVDCTEHQGLASRFGVSGYPTMKFFKNGVVQDYEGPREEEGIVDYMLERADPDWKPPPEAVITLTGENFNEVIGRESLIMVEFYAPWCGHCKQLAPKYEKAAQQLSKMTPPILLAKVDATVEPELASRFEVSGYPTIKVFRKGKAFEYKGGRDEYGIVDYMRKQVEDPSTEKSSVKDIMKHVSTVEDAVILGVFSDESDPMFTVFGDTAAELREDYTFLHSFSADVATHFKVNPGSLVLFRSERFQTRYEAKWHVFSQADATFEDIEKFIKDNDAPLVGQLTMRTKEKLYKESRPLVVVFYTVDWSFDHREATQMWRNKVADIAIKHKSLTFVIADEDDMKDLFKEFGFDESGEEMNIGILDEKERKYPMDAFDSFDSDDITDFLRSFTRGKLQPRIKSQPIPKKQTAVKVVVGKNFDKIVKDPSKDVLIEFYAPWCGHCKKLEPIYKELAKKYKSDKKLVIAKIDATANDYPEEYAASGYPTIYFAPADNKDDPIKHEGGRELEDLEEFISQHATVALGRAPGKDEL